MATTIEELRAVMRMELKPFMRDLQQMNGINAKAARQVEQTWLQTNRRLDHIGKNPTPGWWRVEAVFGRR